MDKSLLSILVCPRCTNGVKKQGKFLTCQKCKLAFPILGKVPNLRIDDAWTLAKAKRAKFSHTLKL